MISMQNACNRHCKCTERYQHVTADPNAIKCLLLAIHPRNTEPKVPTDVYIHTHILMYKYCMGIRHVIVIIQMHNYANCLHTAR